MTGKERAGALVQPRLVVVMAQKPLTGISDPFIDSIFVPFVGGVAVTLCEPKGLQTLRLLRRQGARSS